MVKREGGFMGGEMIFLLAVFMIAVFGVYKYISAENNDYKKLVEVVKTLQGDISTSEGGANIGDLKAGLIKRIDIQKARIDALEELVGIARLEAQEASDDVAKAQEHMARLRESQKSGFSGPIEVHLKPGGTPIEVQIIDRTPVRKRKRITRTQTTKTKTGTKSRSETRVSPLRNDPDEPPKMRAKPRKKIRKKGSGRPPGYMNKKKRTRKKRAKKV
jgi:hypothetical protein